MDTFKGQDNAEIKEFCSKTDCELVIVTRNLTNKCWPLGITINHKAQKFISHKFNMWYGNHASNQLKRGVAPGNVRVLLKNSDLKPLHVRFVTYEYLKQQKGSILNKFDKAGITEAVKSANEVFMRSENSFTEKPVL